MVYGARADIHTVAFRRDHTGADGWSWKNHSPWGDPARAGESERRKEQQRVTVMYWPSTIASRVEESGVKEWSQAWERSGFNTYLVVSHCPNNWLHFYFNWQSSKLIVPTQVWFSHDGNCWVISLPFSWPTSFLVPVLTIFSFCLSQWMVGIIRELGGCLTVSQI